MLVVIKTFAEGVRFYVRPGWQESIDSADVPYLCDLFADLPRRTRNPDDDVFAQLCHLSVGPLRTVEVGELPLGDPFVAEVIGSCVLLS
jgi:hypothetical protein